MKPFVVAVAVLFLTSIAGAEDAGPAKVVRVTGTSEVKVVPDQAVIELGVESQDPSAAAAKDAEAAASRRILASLRANGIGEKDIQTNLLSLSPQASYRKSVKVSYFVATQTFSVTVRDLSKLDTLLDALIKAGGNRIDSVVYGISDLRKYRDQARDLAVKAAREKARALAQALGQEIGKAQAIEEVPDNQFFGAMANSRYENGMPAKAAGATTAAGQTTVSASVTVSFALN
jgi:uncharacterized protein